MADITLQQAQQMVDSWIKTYGVRYFNELTNMTIPVSYTHLTLPTKRIV